MPEHDTHAPLTGRLDGFDGRYWYRCEAGHQVVADAQFLDICTAVTPWFGHDDERNGKPCGADIVDRIVDYRGEGG